MKDCLIRSSIIGLNPAEDTQTLLNKCLNDIRKCLFQNADFVKPPQEATINRILLGSKTSVVIPSEQRCVVLTEHEMIANGSGIDIKGFYNLNTGKIFFNRNWLCIETIYHELLHSVSIPSVKHDVNARHLDFYEGLTEFYTGYLLSKNYGQCYNDCWKLKSEKACQFTYDQQTRIWTAFCHCINIRETVPIYFYNNSNDWELIFQSFIDRIRTLGYPSFTNILKNPKSRPSWVTFHQECLKNFGSKYKEIYDSSDIMDLTNIIK